MYSKVTVLLAFKFILTLKGKKQRTLHLLDSVVESSFKLKPWFKLRTKQSSRSYWFLCSSKEELEDWCEVLRQARSNHTETAATLISSGLNSQTSAAGNQCATSSSGGKQKSLEELLLPNLKSITGIEETDLTFE